jgi:hypothetical protein
MVPMMSNRLSEKSPGIAGITRLYSERTGVAPLKGETIFVTAAAQRFCWIDIRPVVYFLLNYRLIVGRKNRSHKGSAVPKSRRMCS